MMSSIIEKLNNNNLLSLEQKFIFDNIFYEGISGSVSYGVDGATSDIDVVGIAFPPLDYIFPHIAGKIHGLDKNIPNFETYQQHHIDCDNKQYDVSIYGIVKFFQLAIENNPNICDILFLPDRCITYINNAGKLLRSNRKLFLHKGSFHKFIGYSYSQLHKIKTKNPKKSRLNFVEEFGYDTKYASHVIRLALEAEQILTEHTLDLERNSEILKSVRKGEWKLEDIESFFKQKEESLNKLYISSSLRHSPNIDEIKTVFLNCLEEKYGSIEKYLNFSADYSIIRKYEQIKRIVEE